MGPLGWVCRSPLVALVECERVMGFGSIQSIT